MYSVEVVNCIGVMMICLAVADKDKNLVVFSYLPEGRKLKYIHVLKPMHYLSCKLLSKSRQL